eukprot:TRINITY_DN8274_c0_g1_i1.p1 TRINITY_DN8274_c0_g1~~TRINITY_DN8274_c0_g1_i1.p1  ORF type:complete len:232 (-),score=77.14 TRINITY_DN8274_c0_g1_i1:31-657(-)
MVFLFVPQLIGYVRMAALLGGVFFIHSDPQLFIILYMISFGLDVIDGPVARVLGQSTQFGAALDMLTDKMSTPILLMELALLYPTYRAFLRAALLLDIVSHYFLLQNTLLQGRTSHKAIGDDQTWLLRLFYRNKPFFAWTCLGHEAFTVLLFVSYHFPNPLLTYLTLFFAPNFATKVAVHVFQLLSSCEGIARLDRERINAQQKDKKN